MPCLNGTCPCVDFMDVITGDIGLGPVAAISCNVGGGEGARNAAATKG